MSHLPRREAFVVKGVGCWCPSSLTLAQVRAAGHTPECTAAREGWELNMRHLEEVAMRRAVRGLGVAMENGYSPPRPPTVSV